MSGRRTSRFISAWIAFGLISLITTSCGVAPAQVEPCSSTVVDWRYGASEIRVQAGNASRALMERWFATTGHDCHKIRPRLLIVNFNNETDCYIPQDVVCDAIFRAASDDGRYSMELGATNPRINSWHRPTFIGEITLSKELTPGTSCDIEKFRLTIDLYETESKEFIDSAQDILWKKLHKC